MILSKSQKGNESCSLTGFVDKKLYRIKVSREPKRSPPACYRVNCPQIFFFQTTYRKTGNISRFELSFEFRSTGLGLIPTHGVQGFSLISIVQERNQREGGEEVSPALFWKLEKSTLILRKKCPDYGYLWVKFLI